MALTEDEKLALIAVLAIIMIFVLYFEFRVMRGKAKEVRKANIRKDEAFNAVLTCRSVINVLERQGKDISEARSLVDKARRHIDRGEYEVAIDMCDKARDELTRSQSVGPPRKQLAPRVDVDDLETMAEEIVSRPRPRAGADSYQGTRLETQGGPNYLVAKFEIGTAREDISRATREGLDTSIAADMLNSAQAEFDSGNYTKALSLAVKARKAVSPKAAEETIPLRKSRKSERPMPEIDDEADDVVDVCSACGTALEADDAFCASCGAKRAKSRVCGVCGSEALPGDKFCRKCGARAD